MARSAGCRCGLEHTSKQTMAERTIAHVRVNHLPTPGDGLGVCAPDTRTSYPLASDLRESQTHCIDPPPSFWYRGFLASSGLGRD